MIDPRHDAKLTADEIEVLVKHNASKAGIATMRGKKAEALALHDRTLYFDKMLDGKV